MPIDQKAILDQIDTVLKRCHEIASPDREGRVSLSETQITEIISLLEATIVRLTPLDSQYRKSMRDIDGVFQKKYADAGLRYKFNTLTGVLRALRFDYEAGHLQAIHELIHADVFADFLDMADYLLQEGYKDPAAVMAGSVLESHLRKLCLKNGIDVMQSNHPDRSKKADRLNADLAKESVYSKLDQKNVTAWLDLRNKAAHGEYEEYTKEQVALMLQGISDFLTRHPA